MPTHKNTSQNTDSGRKFEPRDLTYTKLYYQSPHGDIQRERESICSGDMDRKMLISIANHFGYQ